MSILLIFGFTLRLLRKLVKRNFLVSSAALEALPMPKTQRTG